ncbi:hypothetical protein [Aeoliella sp.]|uniref:hypothetical protein n=1 Tax=Aeoliella sp. TaxID=2795800 RepID=UPI003CCB7E41
MPYVLCQRHGTHAAPLLCSHLCNAVTNREPLPEAFCVEAWYHAYPLGVRYLCPGCAQIMGVATNRTVWRDEDAMDRLTDLRDLGTVCPRCFDEAQQSETL